MEIESARKYIGREVKVGVPHHDDYNRLFYYYGRLKKVEADDTLVLETKYGIIFVDINQIKQFHVDGVS